MQIRRIFHSFHYKALGITVVFQRHLKGQTPFGIFSDLDGIDGIKYLAFHFLESRLELLWGGE